MADSPLSLGKPKLNLVLCGNNAALKASVSKCFMEENAHQINLVKLPALNQLSEEEVMRETLNCVTFCDPGVHAFLLIVPVGPLTNDDKAEIEKIQKIFESHIKHFIVVFTSELTSGKVVTDLITQNPESQSLISQCGDRYFVLNDPENSQQIPELLDYIENMKTEPYSPEMHLEAQKKTARHETEKEYKEKGKRMEKLFQLTGYLVLTVLCLFCVHLLVFTRLQHIFNTVQGIYPSNSFSDVNTDSMLGKDLCKHQGVTHNDDGNVMRIVLLGKTGVGKSATGNTILRRETFKSEMTSRSLTRECQKDMTEFNRRRITVIDTPGLFDTRVDNVETKKETMKCITMVSPGPHVFLLAIQLGRFTQEEKDAVKMIQEMFGNKSRMHTMVLFTRGDDLRGKRIEDFIEENDSLQYLIQQCGHRYHVFNNIKTEDQTQVSELLEKIEDMVAANGGSFYTNEMFQQVEKNIIEEHERILKEKEEEIKRREEELRIKYEEEIEQIKKKNENDSEEQRQNLKEKYEKEKQELKEKIYRETREQAEYEYEKEKQELKEKIYRETREQAEYEYEKEKQELKEKIYRETREQAEHEYSETFEKEISKLAWDRFFSFVICFVIIVILFKYCYAQ